MPYGHRNSHPRYFGYVPNPSNFVGAMADALASGFNTFSGMWMASPGAAETEALVVDWLRGWCRLPDSGGGLLLSGSSMANLTALVAARQAQFGADGDLARSGTIYYSDQAHSSVAKGARTVGIAPDRHRKVHSDTDFRMSLDHLRQCDRGRPCKWLAAVLRNCGGRNDQYCGGRSTYRNRRSLPASRRMDAC